MRPGAVRRRNPPSFNRSRKASRLGLLAALLALGLATAANAQSGNYLGSIDAATLQVQTDSGPQSSSVEGSLVLSVGEEVSGSRPVSLTLFNLVGSEVPTGSGASGVLGFTLTSSGTASLDTASGAVNLPFTLSVHYPLIDSFFPPTPNANSPGDAPIPFFETFTGTLSGTLDFDPGTSSYLFTGDITVSVTGPNTGKVLSGQISLTDFPFALDVEPIEAISADSSFESECPERNRCKERTLKICPVRIRSDSNDASPTGSSIADQIAKARDVWRQCCIEFAVESTRTITAPDLKTITAGSGPNYSAEETDLLNRINEEKCIEVYFPDRFDPRHSRGDGTAPGAGTANCKVISTDDGSATNTVLLAHELGHCLGLPHPQPPPPGGSVMVPTGKTPPNPPGEGSFNVPLEDCFKISQPLLKQTKKDCCKRPCDGSDSTIPLCTAVVSGETLVVTVQDTGSGLRSIRVVSQRNTRLSSGSLVEGFVNGTKNPFTFRVRKFDEEGTASILFEVKDVCGNVKFCDPVIALVVRETGKPVQETLTGLPQAESFVTIANGAPGLKSLLIVVNGEEFRLTGMRDGEERELDVSSAMLPGEQNTIALTAFGKPGGRATVVIHD